jgi:hypothetical protein
MASLALGTPSFAAAPVDAPTCVDLVGKDGKWRLVDGAKQQFKRCHFKNGAWLAEGGGLGTEGLLVIGTVITGLGVIGLASGSSSP